ncbi:hypothetical protein PENTCL1PPCAC_5031, partial [Pristionchus entomophagus]
IQEESRDGQHDNDARVSLITKLVPTFTVNEAIEASGFSRFQYVLCAIHGLSWLASAMLIMLLAILTPSLHCDWNLSTAQQAMCSTSVFVGWLVASPVWGRVCDLYGRRKGLIAASLVGVIFSILTALAPNYYLFIAARFGVGFANGGHAQSVTLTGEFLPAASRARWLIFLKCFWAVGAAIDAGLAIVILPSLGWRWLVAVTAIPLALFGICSWWLPESIRFDVSKGRLTEARATLDRIAHFNGSSVPEGELAMPKEESAGSSSMMDLLNGTWRRTSIQVWILWATFGAVYYGIAIYTSLLLQSPVDQCGARGDEDLGTRAKRADECRQLTTENYIYIVVTTMSEVPGFILTMFAVEWFGRRGTFAIGFGVFAACSVALTICLPRFIIVTVLFVGRSAIAAVYQTGYMYTSEVYPTSIKAQGLGVASGWGRIGSMATPFIVQMLFSLNLIYPAIVFIVAGTVGAIVSILLPIETSEKSKRNKVS